MRRPDRRCKAVLNRTRARTSGKNSSCKGQSFNRSIRAAPTPYPRAVKPSRVPPNGGPHAQDLCPDDRRDAGWHDLAGSGVRSAELAIWMVATGSGRPGALGGRLGPARALGAPPGELGLPLARAAVAVFTLGPRWRWPVGMERRLGSRWPVGALSRRRLGLPLALAGRHPTATFGNRRSRALLPKICLAAHLSRCTIARPTDRGIFRCALRCDDCRALCCVA
jgi:hypothetical protein